MTAVQIRPAVIADIPAMHHIRLSVHENRLTDPAQIGEDDYGRFVDRGSAWVAETDNGLAGFAAIDRDLANVWALFVDPDAEGRGVGRALHDHMVQWWSETNRARLWLTTGADTRAATFYRRLGWVETGLMETGEIRFERSA